MVMLEGMEMIHGDGTFSGVNVGHYMVTFFEVMVRFHNHGTLLDVVLGTPWDRFGGHGEVP